MDTYFELVMEDDTHLNDKTGPTSLKISFSFSSDTSYGMLPTENMNRYTFIAKYIGTEEHKYIRWISKSRNTYRIPISWFCPLMIARS